MSDSQTTVHWCIINYRSKMRESDGLYSSIFDHFISIFNL